MAQANAILYKYGEPRILDEVREYINGTYTGHYGATRYQPTEVIIDQGRGEDFCIGNIMKYAIRYGKKGTKRDELKKIIHYAIVLMNILDQQRQQ